MYICLWPEFECPGVTLCGWQDIKIQFLTNFETQDSEVNGFNRSEELYKYKILGMHVYKPLWGMFRTALGGCPNIKTHFKMWSVLIYHQYL